MINECLGALTVAECIQIELPRSNSNFCVVYCITILVHTIDTAGSVELLLLLSQEECDRWHAAGLCYISATELSRDKSASAQHQTKSRAARQLTAPSHTSYQ